MNTYDKIELPSSDEAAAHMLPSDLKKFESGEHVAEAFSIAVGNPDETSQPLFTLDQVRAAIEADRKRGGEPVAWSGWGCQYPGKMPRLYGDRSIAEVNCDRENGDQLLYLTAAPQPAEPVNQHSDDTAVDAFAAAMKTKLAKKRAEGRGGWQTCSAEYLSRLLREHVEKGDPVDVANLAMMLHQNGQGIAPAEPVKGQTGKTVLQSSQSLNTPVEVPVIEPSDLRIETYRAEPHSAWAVKADIGVRVTHVPTGLSAACNEDRSVHRNRVLAMEKLQKMLQTRALFAGYRNSDIGQSTEQTTASAEPFGHVWRASDTTAVIKLVGDPRIIDGMPVYTAPVAAQPNVPDGWKLVPVEPTREMVTAGKHTIKGADTTFESMLAELAYRSMIEAAPQPAEPVNDLPRNPYYHPEFPGGSGASGYQPEVKPQEPVKVPSIDELITDIENASAAYNGTPMDCGEADAIARAILARYGNNAGES